MGHMIHTGDCIEVMRTMPDDSVDAICTDPPYGLEFMGKAWDGPALWDGRKGSDDASPGYVHPIKGKAGNWRNAPTYRAGVGYQSWTVEWATEALRVTKPGGYLLAFGGTRTHHRLVCGLEDAGWIIRDELDWIYASGFPKGKANLKPAHEPIVLARKPGPLRPLNIEENRIGYESGADLDTTNGKNPGRSDKVTSGVYGPDRPQQAVNEGGRWPSNLLLSDPELFDEPNPYVVGSGATSAIDRPHRKAVQGTDKFTGQTYNGGEVFARPEDEFGGYGDSGGYSRFFIIPKADRADREPVLRGQVERTKGGSMSGPETRPDRPTNHPIRENAHPTVKPVDLMRHLIRLVTPPGGTILDPFLGSGSTAIAAELEGFPWIGIEQSAEYVAIAEARLNGTQRGLGLDVGAPIRKRAGKWDDDATAKRKQAGWNPREAYGRKWVGRSAQEPDEEPAA